MNLSENKLIVLYKSLDDKEIRKFKKFVKSEFVNSNKDIIQLFELLFRSSPEKMESLSKNDIHKYLYGKKVYNDLRIRHLLSFASEVIESFITFQYFTYNPIFKKKVLLEYLFQNKMDKPAKSSINDLQKDLEGASIHDANYYRDRYELEVANYQFYSNNVRTEDFDYPNAIKHFSIYTIIETLKSACTINTINKVMEVKIQHPFLEFVLKILPESDYLNEPLVKIYHNLYLLIEYENEAVFEGLLADVQKHGNLFSLKDLNTIYRTMINFCIKRSNQNERKFTQYAFDIYIYSIEKYILIEHEEINRFIFTNVITLGIKLEELEKSHQFLKDYQHLIHKDYKENTIQYNLAKMYYAEGNLEDALMSLMTIKFRDKIWNLNSKFLILKILFEQKQYEMFKQQLHTFKIYVRRIQNVGYHKTYFEKVIFSLSALMFKVSGKKKYKDFEFDKDTPDYEWFQKVTHPLMK